MAKEFSNINLNSGFNNLIAIAKNGGPIAITKNPFYIYVGKLKNNFTQFKDKVVIFDAYGKQLKEIRL